ncbi:hypothetical protein [Sorangium sp. So ce128]|uniref:hypothetical protein n=1 Tax=Sorangium sp. So ce128 TaxID=3133281 RepID=UPI003F619236
MKKKKLKSPEEKRLILVDGDKAIFLPSFTPALVHPRPGELKGSGPGTLKGKKLCVEGDEGEVSVANCSYVIPGYSIAGKGTLKISALGSDQKAKKTRTGDKAVLLKGTTFEATFEVQNPAKQPPKGPGPPIPDSTLKYQGKGMFTTTNKIFKGT